MKVRILVAGILLAACAMALPAAEAEAPVKATTKEAFIAVATSVRKETFRAAGVARRRAGPGARSGLRGPRTPRPASDCVR